MHQDLTAYIKSGLAAHQPAETIVAAARQAGHDDAAINAAFGQALNLTVSTGAASAPLDQTIKPNKKSILDLNHLDPTKIFVIIGVVLIIAAIVIVLISQWQNVSPITRIGFVTIPTILLFIWAAGLNSRADYQDIQEAILATASTIFPFSVATTLYQLGIIPEINALLVTVSALAGYGLFTGLEFVWRKEHLAILTIINLYTFVIAFMSHLKVEPDSMLWIIFFVSIMIAALGLFLIDAKKDNGDTHLSAGIILAAISLPIATLSSLNKGAALSFDDNAMIFSVFGPLYLAVAFYLYRLYKNRNQLVIYQLKRGFEEIAPVIFLLPYILIGFSNIGYMLLAIVISFIYLFAAMAARIRSLIPLGSLGIIISIISVTGKYFADSLGWPVIVFVSGFTMLGVGYFARQISKNQQQTISASAVWGLGEDPTLAHQNQTSGFSLGRILLLLILLVGLGPLLFWLFLSFL